MNTRRSYSDRLCVQVVCGLASFMIFSTVGACSPDAPLDDAALASARAAPCDATYENFAAEFFGRYCLACHNNELVGDLTRFDAPTGINFNSLNEVRGFQNRIRLRAGIQGDMPPRLLPVAQPTQEERLRLIQWIDCGAPQ